jgi:hypothetical protein
MIFRQGCVLFEGADAAPFPFYHSLFDEAYFQTIFVPKLRKKKLKGRR